MTAPKENLVAAEPVNDERVLRITRTFDAVPQDVYRAFTDPEQLVQWWGPEGNSIPEYHMDVAVGGAWRTVMISTDGAQNIVSGVYRELNEPSRLVFTWAWETKGVRGHETVVTIELRDCGGKTELTLTQALFESVTDSGNHDIGWASSFRCLDLFLA